MRKNYPKLYRGQTLIEVIVALGVAVILAVSLITTSLLTQKAARSARNSTQATKLAQEYIEQIRVYRDRKGYVALTPQGNPPVNDVGTPPGYCYRLDSTTITNPEGWQLLPLAYPACSNSEPLGNSSFNRKIEFSTPGSNKKLVTVTVTWTDSSGTQTVTNQTFLTNWEGLQ